MLHRQPLPGFRGDLDWIHSFEGHAGKPYWPGGASGVTLDPGFDLGYADESLFMSLYAPHLSHKERQACLDAKGIRGSRAYEYLRKSDVLETLRIPFETAKRIFPHLASSYWGSLLTRFPVLNHVPAEVQTVMMSLAINRGPGNSAFSPLREPLQEGEWKEIGRIVKQMQQDHTLRGIRQRRREEGAYIKESIREAKFRALTKSIETIELDTLQPLAPRQFDVTHILEVAADYEA